MVLENSCTACGGGSGELNFNSALALLESAFCGVRYRMLLPVTRPADLSLAFRACSSATSQALSKERGCILNCNSARRIDRTGNSILNR